MRAGVSHWKLDRPTVVAEIPPTSQFYSVSEVLEKSSANGFQGLLFWAYNDPSFSIGPVLAPLKSFATQHKATYAAILAWLSAPTPAPTPPACTDELPQGSQYSCEQQKTWGKCSESWM